MCNLSDLVEERGIVKGREAERKDSIRIMVKMLKDLGITIESAIESVAEKFEMDLEDVYKIIEKSEATS